MFALIFLLGCTFSEKETSFDWHSLTKDVTSDILGDAVNVASLPIVRKTSEDNVVSQESVGKDAELTEENVARIAKNCNTWRSYESCRINTNCHWTGNKNSEGQHCKGSLNLRGSILSSSQNEWLSKTLVSQQSELKNKKAVRCYSKHANGGNGAAFHRYCNNKGPTVTIVKLNTGRIVGGYTSGSWSGSGYLNSRAWLFSVTNRFVHSKYRYHHAMYRNNGYGPTWGGGHDFCIHSNWNGYCNLGHNFKCRTSSYGQTACRNDFCGRYSGWSVNNMEVYYFKNHGVEEEIGAESALANEDSLPIVIASFGLFITLIAIILIVRHRCLQKDPELVHTPLLYTAKVLDI